ncbi:long-chain-fatty-acid--CoA ligase [Castellaniella sp.]|uniref:long-chain-fatty-acid--CoA ligase n=1 Tax=Castellaniella sp. TaxID=1955812 RepID=UPI0035601E33
MARTLFSEIRTDTARSRCGLTLDTVLASGIETGGMQSIMTDGEMPLSYHDLGRRIRQLGHALTAHGLTRQSRVAILERDTHRYLEAYFAVPMLGAILMTVNIRLSVDQMRYTLDHSQTEIIITAAEFLPVLEQIYAQRKDIPPIIVIGHHAFASSSGLPLPVICDYEAMLTAATDDFYFPTVDENTVATHFYTTGTTGLPKGVTYTHRQLVTHTLATGFALGTADDYQAFRRNDVYMPLTPMFHVHAWGLPYVATLLGVKHIYPGKYDAAGIVKLVQSEGVTFSHCVPTILQLLLVEIERNALDLTGWKIMVGGAAMSPALAKRAMAAGLQVFTGYGMSETCPVISFARTSKNEALSQPEKLCRVGHAMPLTELRIHGSNDPGKDHRGELVARAVWLTDAYFRDTQMSATLWQDGFLHTGDVAVHDDDGAFRIVDRTKDMIKTGGEWLSSLDLEARIAEHPDVEEVAVIARRDEKWGERPCAFVKLRPSTPEQPASGDAPSKAAEIREILQQRIHEGRLPPYAIPDEFHFVDMLPRTSVGKLDKKNLRAMLEQGTEKSPTDPAPQGGQHG